jgi:hypothetical protein
MGSKWRPATELGLDLPMVAVVELDVLKLLGPLHTWMRRIPVAEVPTESYSHAMQCYAVRGHFLF